MFEPILKSGWERRHEHVKLDANLAASLMSPVISNQIESLEILDAGCANTNYKVTCSDNSQYVIRIYTRDPAAVIREAGIYNLVKHLLPVATLIYHDDSCTLYPYPYAIFEWVNGQLMRDIILSNDETATRELMHEAGLHLGILRALKLPYGGFFDGDMRIRPFSQDEEYETYMMNLLQTASTTRSLSQNLIADLQQLVSQCCNLLPEANDANLTHADYDPANILVQYDNHHWKISAILDWEFSFSGSYLFDVGTMLRYSHKLPDYYQSSFISGIEENSTTMSTDWMKQAKLLDLISLLQLLEVNPAAERPFVNRDLVRLITHTVKNFTSL